MKFKISILVFSVLFVAACTSLQDVDTLATDARNDATAINNRAKTSFENAYEISSDDYVHEVTTPILAGRTTAVERTLPELFKQGYFFNPNGEKRLIDIVKKLSSDTGLVITARDDVYNPRSANISAIDNNGNIDSAAVQLVNDVRTESNLDVADRVKLPAGSRYEGDIEGFFDYLSSVLNISWVFLHEEDRVLLTRYVERSYPLFVPPSDSGEGEGSNIWSDTEESLETLLSEGGQVTVNQLSGMISVVDTEDVHNMINEHIKRINRRLSKSVQFRLEILSFSANDRRSEGFDLSLVHTGAKDTISLAGAGISIPGAVGLTASITDGPFDTSRFIQQNLAEKGEVAISRDTIIRSMNNQRVTFEQIRTVPVISEFTPSTQAADGTRNQGGVSLEDIEVGFKGEIVPSIMDDGQNMVVSLDLETSFIEEIVDIQVGSDGQFVQSARTSSREYEHIFPMRNAETLVISGFYDRTNEFYQNGASNSWFSWLFSGMRDNAERQYYIVLLTPEISNGTSEI